MKILITIGWPLSHGGHLSSTLCLGNKLIEYGNNVSIIAPNGPMKAEFTQKGIEVFPCKQFVRKLPGNLLAIPTIMATALKGKFDVIHAMDYQALYPSFIAASLLGKPFVFTKAGGETPDYSMPPSDSVIVYSQELLDGMQGEYPAIEKKLTLIKARIDTELFYPYTSAPSCSSTPFQIFMAMRLEEGKRPWLTSAINGIKQLAAEKINFSFSLAGDGALREELEKQARTINNIHGREVVRLLGPISKPEKMRDYYNSADIVIGHGRGILEAMACRKPVICLGKQSGATLLNRDTVDLVSEFNFSGRHMAAYPETSQPIVDLIKSIIQQPEKRRLLAGFSLQYIKEEYAVENGAQQLLNIYDSICTTYAHGKLVPRVRWLIVEIICRINKLIFKITAPKK